MAAFDEAFGVNHVPRLGHEFTRKMDASDQSAIISAEINRFLDRAGRREDCQTFERDRILWLEFGAIAVETRSAAPRASFARTSALPSFAMTTAPVSTEAVSHRRTIAAPARSNAPSPQPTIRTGRSADGVSAISSTISPALPVKWRRRASASHRCSELGSTTLHGVHAVDRAHYDGDRSFDVELGNEV
nr:hypothetical protein [uncultured Shinella sp.]